MFKEAGLRSPRTQLTKVKIEISVRGRRTEARMLTLHLLYNKGIIRQQSLFWTLQNVCCPHYSHRIYESSIYCHSTFIFIKTLLNFGCPHNKPWSVSEFCLGCLAKHIKYDSENNKEFSFYLKTLSKRRHFLWQCTKLSTQKLNRYSF